MDQTSLLYGSFALLGGTVVSVSIIPLFIRAATSLFDDDNPFILVLRVTGRLSGHAL